MKDNIQITITYKGRQQVILVGKTMYDNMKKDADSMILNSIKEFVETVTNIKK